MQAPQQQQQPQRGMFDFSEGMEGFDRLPSYEDLYLEWQHEGGVDHMDWATADLV
jgi:hypothetical protein